ncbi:MAG TPA: outer membrane beta-barrel protein [Opitutus sp.]|nr:outer membrane beta-barrel protein [Opitutus sp.]
MNLARALLIGGLLTSLPAWAVYAPLPDQDQGKDWSVSLRAGVAHDSNIFGAQSGAISSMVYGVSPKVAYNGSLTDQTFAAFGYTLTLDHIVDRPGEKTLDSHDLMARIAHAFSRTANIDVSDYYQIAKNPESLLAGLPLNTNQSFKRNEFNARFTTSPLPKFGTALKFHSVAYDYDNAVLAASLDRTENLFGASGSYDVLPEAKAVIEYRRENIDYRTGGNTKNKDTDFVIGGVDYAVAKKMSLSARLGHQWRNRVYGPSTSGLYAEFSSKYDYAERSFLAAGFVRTFEETSNVATYSDTRVNRLFVNLQHALSALIVASGSFTYEPSVLQGRLGNPDADETTTRAGVAITWLPTQHWSVSASYDHDKVRSDDPGRGQKRDRVGVSVGYAF